MLNRPLWRRLLVFTSALFLGVLVLGGFLLARTTLTRATPPPAGAAKAAAAPCSLATLQGTYVTAAHGFEIVGSDRVPFALAASATYDGKGHVQGVFSYANGKEVEHQVPFTGTYTVKPDCTVTETDRSALGTVDHFDEFTTPDGSLITSVQTDPGAVSASVLSRRTSQPAGN